MGIRIALFGQPRVTSSDGTREFELSRKTLNVLAYLILNRTRPVSRDSVAFALFPDESEEKARTSLRRNLSHLLAAFPGGKQYVTADTERLAWNAGAPAHVDVIAFEEALRAGNDEGALAEYAGQLLPTLYDEWTTADRERLRDAFHEALVRTVARERSQRRFARATSCAHRLLDEDPWREDVVRQLIAIRYEAGDRAGALAAFERFATRLRAEMHADPMPETIALRDAVLRGARLASSERRPAVSADTSVDLALPFVGRAAEMQRARECWHSAADGRPGLLLVAGEAGAGKSRFVTELARLVESEGGSVLRGYTPAGGEYRPYEAFVEALEATPDLLDDQITATITDDRAARLRLFDSVRRRLSDSARRRVLALVLEDMHWAGQATLDLLEFVLRRFEREPILVVATFRDDELSRAHPLRALLRQLHGRGSVTELSLERLNARDAAAAVRAALPETGADQAAVDRAVAWAGGVPLLLDEAARDLAAGRTSNAADITALVGERFGRLSPNAETALVFGALLGERFELDTLATVTGWRDAEVIEAIGEGIDHGLLRVSSRAPGLAFAFRHDLIRVAATQRIAASERNRAHGLIANALATQAADDGSRAGEVARHYAEAGEPLRAADYYCRAGRYALDVFANDDAIRLATLGLERCGAGDPSRRLLRYDLLAVREQGLARAGAIDRRRADARELVSLADDDDRAATAVTRLFEAHFEDAAIRTEALSALETIAVRSPGASRTLAYLRARDAMRRGDYTAARDAAIEAAEAFDAAGDVRAAMTARFSLLFALKLLGYTGEAARVIESMRPLMDASDDLAMRADFHRIASSALVDLTTAGVALEDARASLSLALRIGDRYAEARARQNVAVISGRSRAYEEAFAQQELSLAAFRDLGNDEGVADSIINAAAWRRFCGDFEGCAKLLDDFGPLEHHIPLTQLKFVQLQASLNVARGKSEGPVQLADARRRAGELKASYFAARIDRELAAFAASEGRLDDALALLEVALAAVPPNTNRQHEAETLALSARVRAALGEPHGIDEAARAMRLVEDEHMQAHGEIAWNAAAAYAIAGDTTTAMTLAGSAVAASVREALGMPANLAETFLALPWNREAVDFLWGRDVPLRWENSQRPAIE